MSPFVADMVGIAGSVTMIGAYAYSNLAKPIDLMLFNALNLVGAILLFTSLTVHFNLASMLLEIVWSMIALFGLAKATIDRRRA